MGISRTFVGFSSTDILSYRLMCAWKASDKMAFNFIDCQLKNSLNSEDEAYIKGVCRLRIDMAGTYIMLIGKDTKSKYKYVKWEAEVALEKGCRIIGVNLDKWRYMNPDTCPPVIRNVGAVFVPYFPQIVAHALEDYKMNVSRDWHYPDETYQKLGYIVSGNTVERQKSLAAILQAIEQKR